MTVITAKMYSGNEYTDMILVVGECLGNLEHAVQLYGERFPNRRHPDANVLRRLLVRSRETGHLVRAPEVNLDLGRPRSVRNAVMEEAVLDLVTENGRRSTRSIAGELGLSQTSVCRVLNEEGLYPYHATKVQALLPEDFVLRRNFCNWLLQQHRNNNEFVSHILWTDEANFTRDRFFNSRNTHLYALENPHFAIQMNSQHHFSVNVWAGILGSHLLGPVFLPHQLNGQFFLFFLQNELQELLEDLPLAATRNMWFQLDGAPAHFAAAVRDYLDDEFNVRWIGRNGPVRWPPRSPDITCLDFFLWSHIKSLVYSSPVPSEENLIERIRNAFATVNAEILHNVQLNIVKRAQLCLDHEGQNFEQFL